LRVKLKRKKILAKGENKKTNWNIYIYIYIYIYIEIYIYIYHKLWLNEIENQWNFNKKKPRKNIKNKKKIIHDKL